MSRHNPMIRRRNFPVGGFVSDRSGVVAVLFALALLPLIGLIGLAIDFAVASQAKQQLDLALDAATMQAVTAAAQATTVDPNASIVPAEASGVQRFTAQAGSLAQVSTQPATIVITRSGTTFTAVGTYNGIYQTYLGALFGVPTMSLNGTATAVYQTQPYTDVQVLLDTSGSMTIGGSLQDIQALQNLTAGAMPRLAGLLPTGMGACGFACHWTPSGVGLDYYALTRGWNGNPPITLRIDQLKSAIGSIATSINAANGSGRYRLGIWTFDDSLTQIGGGLTSNVASLESLASAIEPAVFAVTPLNINFNVGDTDLNGQITAFAQRYVSRSGDGTSPAAPKKFIFIMTDGVQDLNNSPVRHPAALDPSVCNTLKDPNGLNATVAILYTPFDSAAGGFDEIAGLYNQPTGPDLVAQGLQACASSPNLYYEAGSQADINNAINQFLTNVLGIPARIAN